MYLGSQVYIVAGGHRAPGQLPFGDGFDCNYGTFERFLSPSKSIVFYYKYVLIT
jgi:hypothetical protein